MKILEAMAAGVPVVSTALGAEGLAAHPDEHFLLADSPELMCDAVLGITSNSSLFGALSSAGRRLIETRYDWNIIGDSLRQIYESLPRNLERRTRAARQ